VSLTALNFSLYYNFTTTLLLRRYFDFIEYCPSGSGQAPANGAVSSASAWAPVGGTPDMWVSLAAGSQCQTKLQANDGTSEGISFTDRLSEQEQKGTCKN